MNKESKSVAASLDVTENASVTLSLFHYAKGEREGLHIVRSELKKQLTAHIESLQNGDLSQIEAMLYSQAITLQEVFNKQISFLVLTENLQTMQQMGQLALKTQNACRATLATLANIKNPKHATFIGQQNNATIQQVNNNKSALIERKNELLTEKTHEALDIGGALETIPVNSKVETVDKVYRS